MSTHVLQQLMSTIESRKANPSERSYTASLLAGGLPKISEKVLEEAGELVDAAAEGDSEHVCAEAADLFYHVLVLLADADLRLSDVEGVLAGRFGISGLDEKASRKPTGDSGE